mgnify:CR=1 FL=1
METLIPIAHEIADKLMTRGETVAVSESSAGGLISAALLAVPGVGPKLLEDNAAMIELGSSSASKK